MTILPLPQNYILCYFRIVISQANPTIITLVLLVTGLVLIQTTILIITLFLARQHLESLNQKLQQLSDTANQRSKFAHRTLDIIETALKNLPALEDITKQKLGTFTKTAQKIDRNITQTIHTLRSEVARASNRVNTTLNSFSRQTYYLHKFLINPPTLLSSLFKNFLMTLKQKLAQKKKSSDTHSPDSELFI